MIRCAKLLDDGTQCPNPGRWVPILLVWPTKIQPWERTSNNCSSMELMGNMTGEPHAAKIEADREVTLADITPTKTMPTERNFLICDDCREVACAEDFIGDTGWAQLLKVFELTNMPKPSRLSARLGWREIPI